MCSAGSYPWHMFKTIQIRNVPEALHRQLNRARPSKACRCPIICLPNCAERSSGRLPQSCAIAWLAQRTPTNPIPSPAEAIRAERDSRRSSSTPRHPRLEPKCAPLGWHGPAARPSGGRERARPVGTVAQKTATHMLAQCRACRIWEGRQENPKRPVAAFERPPIVVKIRKVHTNGETGLLDFCQAVLVPHRAHFARRA